MQKMSYEKWSEPHIQFAKAREIKFTRKNKQKLRDAWISYLGRNFGINGIFWGVYKDNIQNLVQQECGLLKLLSDIGKELTLPKPAPTARYFTWTPYNEYGFIEHKPGLDKLPILWYSSIYGKEEQDSCRDRISGNSDIKSSRRTRDLGYKADLIYNYLGSKRSYS